MDLDNVLTQRSHEVIKLFDVRGGSIRVSLLYRDQSEVNFVKRLYPSLQSSDEGAGSWRTGRTCYLKSIKAIKRFDFVVLLSAVSSDGSPIPSRRCRGRIPVYSLTRANLHISTISSCYHPNICCIIEGPRTESYKCQYNPVTMKLRCAASCPTRTVSSSRKTSRCDFSRFTGSWLRLGTSTRRTVLRLSECTSCFAPHSRQKD